MTNINDLRDLVNEIKSDFYPDKKFYPKEKIWLKKFLPEHIFLSGQFLEQISIFKNIYIELSGGYHSTTTVLLFHELKFKNIFLLHNDTKLQYKECMDNIHKLINITDYPIIFIKPFHKRKLSDIMKESFRNIEIAKGKHNYRDYFKCCRILKKQASKSWINKNLLDNSVIISSLLPYESFNRQMRLYELKKQNTYLRFHKTQNCFKGYPYRDYLYGHRNYSRKIYEVLFENKLREYELNINHSGCKICPIRIMNPKLLEKNDCSIKYNRIFNN